jgi:hypothetical protein
VRKLLTIALTTFTLTATLSAIAPSASAVENGTAVAQAPPWSAYVVTGVHRKYLGLEQAADYSCTGTIIADDWVLTAAHCVYNEQLTSQLPLSSLRVILGRSDLSQTLTGGQWTVDRVEVDHDFKHSPSPPNADVALLHLHGALPGAALPMALAPQGFAPGSLQPVSAYGYGLVSAYYVNVGGQWELDYKSPQTVYATHLHVTQPGSYEVDGGCSTAALWCFSDIGPSQVSPGDSGGPWVTDTQNPSILGVQSTIAGAKQTSAHSFSYAFAGAPSVTTSSAQSWIDGVTGLTQAAHGTIYRNSSTGAAYLVDNSGFAEPIPTGGDYQCFVAQGHHVVNESTFKMAELPKTSITATCSSSSIGPKSSILIYGDGDFGEDPTGMDNLAGWLRAGGDTVTELAGTTALPPDLSGYGQIWHYGVDPISATDQSSLENFLTNGGSVYLTGEWGNGGFGQQEDLSIINDVVPSPIAITDDSSGTGQIALPINPAALDGFASTPNTLTTWTGVDVGGLNGGDLTGVSSQNVIAFNQQGDAAGALWDVGAAGGRLAILMDVNWAQSSYGDMTTAPLVAQNLARFLSVGLA